MTRLANYSSKAVMSVLCDIPLEDGLEEDEFITVEPEGDAYGEEIGADGSVCRFATNETRYKVTVKLKGFSRHNSQFAALHAADTNATNGAGVGAFMVKDLNGSTLMGSNKCWIMKAPAKGFGKSVPSCEWVFRVVATPGQMLVGGN